MKTGAALGAAPFCLCPDLPKRISQESLFTLTSILSLKGEEA